MQLAYLLLDIGARLLLLAVLTYYLVTNLQWYNYSLLRVLTKHHRRSWHIYYFALPLLGFLILYPLYGGLVFYTAFVLVFLPSFCLWYKKLDKKLVHTPRVIRLLASVALIFVVCEFFRLSALSHIFLLVPLIGGLLASLAYEGLAFRFYAYRARAKLLGLENLIVIAVTGSYGKTSTKNFIYELLSPNFKTYATPRSVNTLKGLVADINQNLQSDTQIYIAEAGARSRGDLAQIAALLSHHYAVIGKIGGAHLEYFKNLDNTTRAKFELLYSSRLKKAFVHAANTRPVKRSEARPGELQLDRPEFDLNLDKLVAYPPVLQAVRASLDGLDFELELDGRLEAFSTEILGRFNIDNIAVALLLARELGVPIPKIRAAIAGLKPVPHRLCKIVTPQKIILDDSFNGNLEGMLEALYLASLHEGRKVIVTPGLVECDEESNLALCKRIDEVFDLVIITGALNAALFDSNIQRPQKILLKDKLDLESTLSKTGQPGDLVLFANDAPSYV